MSATGKAAFLKSALLVFGLIFVIGLPVMMHLWPAGWTWEPRQPEYEQMMMGIYGTLGIFLIMASRNPHKHTSLIWFTIWSSIVHGAIMLVQALRDSAERANLLGDVPALFVVAAVLWILMPATQRN
jgi:hypothetical protein